MPAPIANTGLLTQLIGVKPATNPSVPPSIPATPNTPAPPAPPVAPPNPATTVNGTSVPGLLGSVGTPGFAGIKATPTSTGGTASALGNQIASTISSARQKYPGNDGAVLDAFIRDNQKTLPTVVPKLQNLLGQGRVYQNNNLLAAPVETGGTNVTTEALDQAGIKWTYGNAFSGNPKMSTINILGDPVKAATAILSNSPDIQTWYATSTGKNILNEYGIKTNEDFKNASPQIQEAVIAGIKKNEAGSSGYTATQILNQLVADNQAPNPQSTPVNSSASSMVPDNFSLGNILKNTAHAAVEPELKGLATGARAVQATPNVYGAVSDAISGNQAGEAGNIAAANNTMAKPVLGQKTLEGSTVDENLGSAATAASQLVALKIPDIASSIQENGVKGALQKLIQNKYLSGALKVGRIALVVKGITDNIRQNGGKLSVQNLTLPQLMEIAQEFYKP